jgi:hypothetical protein
MGIARDAWRGQAKRERQFAETLSLMAPGAIIVIGLPKKVLL